MSDYQSLLGQLEELLTQKKSKKFYAQRLGISEYEVTELLKELREKHTFIDRRLNTNHCHTTCEHGKSCCCICDACGPVGVCVQMLDKTDTIARGTEAERRESTNQKNLCYMMRQVSIEE